MSIISEPSDCIQIPEAVINMHLDAGCSTSLTGTKRARQSGAWVADSHPDSSQDQPEPKRIRPAGNEEAEGLAEQGSNVDSQEQRQHQQNALHQHEAERSAEQGSNADSQGQWQHQQNALHMLVRSSRALGNCRGAHHELSGVSLACAW